MGEVYTIIADFIKALSKSTIADKLSSFKFEYLGVFIDEERLMRGFNNSEEEKKKMTREFKVISQRSQTIIEFPKSTKISEDEKI